MGKERRKKKREVKKVTVEISLEIYNKFIELAVKKFGYYGAFKKALEEAMELWVEREKEKLR